MQPKILVVDDDEDFLDVVKIILTTERFQVDICSSTMDVEEIVKFYNPDVILLDLLFYGISGADVCKNLKRISNTPILLSSAYPGLEQISSNCDADGFIKKPFEIIHFLKKIRSTLNIVPA